MEKTVVSGGQMLKYYNVLVAISVFFVFVLAVPSVLAKSSNDKRKDLVAPKVTDLVINESINTEQATKIQILVSVTDNDRIKSGYIYFRNLGSKKYKRVKMSLAKDISGYDYLVDLNKIKDPGFEYYIQVEDAAGNVSLYGNAFSPLVFHTGKKWVTQKSYVKGTHVANLGVNFGSDMLSGQLGLEYYPIDKIGAGIRASKLNYDYTEAMREESGSTLGMEAYVRYFPTYIGYEGLYIGGGLGLWSLNWRWDDINDAQEITSGRGHSDAISVALHLGWRFQFAYSGFYFEPNIALGKYFQFNVETSDNKNELNLDSFVTGGLIFGVAF